MAGFDNGCVIGTNVDFTGNSESVGIPQVVADGQLLIGSTAAPNIRVATLTAGSGVSITNGAGAITIGLSGGGTAIDSLLPDSGTTPVVPNGLGQVSLVGSGSTTTVGGVNSLSVELTGLTNHAVLVGAGTSTITKVGPSATTGAPLISAGAAADPAFSTTFTVVDSTFTATEAGSNSGGNVTSTVSNTSNTASSNALSQVTVAGTSAGDAFQTFTVTGGGSWSHGVDNSASDVYKISNSTALGTTDVVTVTGNTQVLLNTAQTLTSVATAGGVTQVGVINTDNTNDNSAARVTITNGGTSGGDTYVLYDQAGATAWEAGVDESAGTFLLNYGSTGATANMSGTTVLSASSATGIVNFVTGITLNSGTTLSNYTEGTWTPTMVGNSTAGTTTYTVQQGYYTRIGNMVTIWGNVQGSAATGTGTAIFGGFPFTIKNQSNYAPAGSVSSSSAAGWAWPVGSTSLVFIGTSNTLTGFIYVSGTAGANNFLQMANAAFSYQFTLSYQV